MSNLLQSLSASNQADSNSFPEKRLLAALVLRGISDYIMVLMYDRHKHLTAYSYSEIKDSRTWIKYTEPDFSAYKCCMYLNVSWSGFIKYIKYLESVSDDLQQLKRELLQIS